MRRRTSARDQFTYKKFESQSVIWIGFALSIVRKMQMELNSYTSGTNDNEISQIPVMGNSKLYAFAARLDRRARGFFFFNKRIIYFCWLYHVHWHILKQYASAINSIFARQKFKLIDYATHVSNFYLLAISLFIFSFSLSLFFLIACYFYLRYMYIIRDGIITVRIFEKKMGNDVD